MTTATAGGTTKLSSSGRDQRSEAAAATEAATTETKDIPRADNTTNDAASTAPVPIQLFGSPSPHRPPTADAIGSATAAVRIPATGPGTGIHAAPAYPHKSQKAPHGRQDSSGRNTGTVRASTSLNAAKRRRTSSTKRATTASPVIPSRRVSQPANTPTSTTAPVLTWIVRRKALSLTGGCSRRRERCTAPGSARASGRSHAFRRTGSAR